MTSKDAIYHSGCLSLVVLVTHEADAGYKLPDAFDGLISGTIIYHDNFLGFPHARTISTMEGSVRSSLYAAIMTDMEGFMGYCLSICEASDKKPGGPGKRMLRAIQRTHYGFAVSFIHLMRAVGFCNFLLSPSALCALLLYTPNMKGNSIKNSG